MRSIKVKSRVLRWDEIGEDWIFEWLDHPMRKELRKIKGNRRLAEPNRKLLYDLVRLPNGNTKRKEALRGQMAKIGMPVDFVNDISLKRWYTEITPILDRRFGLTEAFDTDFEERFDSVFKGVSRRKIIPGAWIGPYCADLYCPSIRVGKCVGVVFEIDGGVHDIEGKGRKDNYRDEYFNGLGIYVMHIDNHMVTSKLIQNTLASFRGIGSADSNSIRNKWRKIWIETLAHWESFFPNQKLIKTLVL